MKVKINCDSTCDLSPELIEKYGIDIQPLYVVKGGHDYRDGLEINPDDIYAHVAAGGDLCSTSAVSVSDYMELFAAQKAQHEEILHFSISSSMSACYQNSCIAAAEYEGIYPVDSKNLSTAIGLQALAACEMAEKGMSGEEIHKAICEMSEKVEASFVVDSIDYLHKGGRCSSVAALGANLLGLKPCINVIDGAMLAGKKYRGKIFKCIMQYVRERLEGRDDIDTHRIFITNSGGFTDEELAQVEAEVRKYQDFDEILHTRAGCTISSHCGPKTLGIIFARK